MLARGIIKKVSSAKSKDSETAAERVVYEVYIPLLDGDD